MDDAPEELDRILQRGFRYALALTHDRDSARDLVQDGCVRVVRRGGGWSVGYFLSAIRSAWIDRGRHERRGVRAPHSSERAVPVEPIDPPGALPDEALDSALATLGVDERELLYLAVVEGYTASELAKRTSSPRGTVLSRLHRAKQKLRARLPDRRFEVDA